MLPLLLLLACAHDPAAMSAPPPPTAPAAPSAPPAPAAPPAPTAALAALSSDPVVAGLLAAGRADQMAWERLAYLCDHIGHRLTGSTGLAAAIDQAEAWLRADGQQEVRRESVMVPHWERGTASLQMLSPRAETLGVLALGGSVGTPGVTAQVAVIDEESDLGPALKGRIALFNFPMQEGVPAGPRYGAAAKWRVQGPSLAAQHGAVASLTRSVTTRSLYTPHTGMMRYDPAFPSIPAAAITPEDADWISRLVASGASVELRLALGARVLPDVESHNVMGQITGGTWPEEIVLIGAHIDSWDVGQGAHDDGAGVIEVIEALRLIRASGATPRRTIRAVLFTSEENGAVGGRDYAARHAGERHVAAIESDIGGGAPMRWGATGSPTQMGWLSALAAPLGIPVTAGGGGADIGPLGASGTLLIGLGADDSRYFDVHHTEADTLDKVDPAALKEATAALAALTWLLANADPPAEAVAP